MSLFDNIPPYDSFDDTNKKSDKRKTWEKVSDDAYGRLQPTQPAKTSTTGVAYAGSGNLGLSNVANGFSSYVPPGFSTSTTSDRSTIKAYVDTQVAALKNEFTWETGPAKLADKTVKAVGSQVMFSYREPQEERIVAWKVPEAKKTLDPYAPNAEGIKALANYFTSKGVDHEVKGDSVIVGDATFKAGDWVVENYNYENGTYVYALPTLDQRKKFDQK